MRLRYHQYLDQGHPSDYRADEVRSLNRAVFVRENRLVIGLPGMGVSNLLRFWVSHPQLYDEDVVYAYVNGDALIQAMPADLWNEIARQLHAQGLVKTLETDIDGYERLRLLLLSPQNRERQRIALVIDQCDTLLAAVDRAFYRQLKALTDLNKRVCIFLATSPIPASAADPEDLLFAGRRLYVGPFCNQDARLAVQEEGARLGIEFGPDTVDRLVHLTGGHPGLLRAISSAADEQGLTGSDTDAFWLQNLLSRDDVNYRNAKIWRALEPQLRQALAVLAKQCDEPVCELQATKLEQLGLVRRQGSRREIFSPLFERFVQKQPGADNLEGTSQTVRQHSAEAEEENKAIDSGIQIQHPTFIIRNGQEIIVAGKVAINGRTIHVTPLELRFLACLLQEPRIYTKDEIAAYVYFDEDAFGDGIADSRIENLVRQVRRRLPIRGCIKTHRGLGYEFVSAKSTQSAVE